MAGLRSRFSAGAGAPHGAVLLAAAFFLLLPGCTDTLIRVVSVASVEVRPGSATLEQGATLTLEARLEDESGNRVTGRTVNWSSDATSVAEVDAAGVVTGVGPGTTQVRASAGGVQGSAQITVLGPPALALELESVELTAVAGHPTQASAALQVTNEGSGSLGGLSVQVRYDDGAAAPAASGQDEATDWLSATLNSPSTPTVLVLVARARDLPVGEHRAWVDLSSPDAENSPVTVEVVLNAVAGSPIPFVLGVQPGSAPAGATLGVVVDGAGFQAGLTSLEMGEGIQVSNVSVVSATTMTATVSVSQEAAPGPRNVTVTNPEPGGGTSVLEDGFQVTEALNPEPQLTGAEPSTGPRGESLDVELTGEGFVDGVTTADFGSGIQMGEVEVTSAATLRAHITIEEDAALGARDITVTNSGPGGGTATLVDGFQVTEGPSPEPQLTALDPESGARGSTLDVELTGDGFVQDVTTVDFGGGVQVGEVEVASSTSLTATVTIASDAELGLRDVSVTNPEPGGGTATLEEAFEVTEAANPSPSLTGVSPTQGEQGETLDVELTGDGFVAGVSQVSFGAGIAVDAVVVSSSTSMTVTIIIGGAASTGTRDVSVTNPEPGGGVAVLTGAFQVLASGGP